MTDAIGLGVVGLGFMGRRYARFLSGTEGVCLAGVYDLDGDLAREVAAKCGGTVYPDLDSLVAAAGGAGVLVIGAGGVIQIDQLATGLESWTAGQLDTGLEGIFWSETYGVPGGALGLEIRHFADCVRGRREPAIQLADAIEALRLSLAMEQSAATGEVVDLTTFGEPRPAAPGADSGGNGTAGSEQ